MNNRLSSGRLLNSECQIEIFTIIDFNYYKTLLTSTLIQTQTY